MSPDPFEDEDGWPEWMSARIQAEAESLKQHLLEMVQMNELDAPLNELSVRSLITALRQLNGGPLGYDFSKKDKSFLLQDAKAKALSYANSKYPKQGFAKTIADIRKWTGDDRQPGEGNDNKDESRDDDSGGLSGKGQARGKGESEKPGDGEGEPTDGQPKNPIAREVGKQIQQKLLKGEILSPQKGLTRQEAEEEYIKKSEAKKIIHDEVTDQVEKQSRVYRVQIVTVDGQEITEESGKPRHKVFPEVLRAVSAGLNVLLVGPAGCGKTHMAEQVSDALRLPFRFTGAVSSEYKLLGFIDAQGRTVDTEYRKAYKDGGVFLWDEMDASSPQALLAFNAGLANGRQDFPDAIIPRHKDFRAIASANTYGSGADRLYVGRNQLDAASLDRFYVVAMDYDAGLERTLYGDNEWVQYVWAARKVVRGLNIRHVVSMRAIDFGLRMIKAGSDRGQVEKSVLWRHMDTSDLQKVMEKLKGFKPQMGGMV